MNPIVAVDSSEQNLIFTFIYVASQMPEAGQPIQRLLIEPSFDRYWKAWGRSGDIAVKAIDLNTQMPIGCAWLRLFSEDEAGPSFVGANIPELTIGVLDGWRGQGIGRKLIEALIQEAVQQKLPAISISVREDNPALKLYQALTFQRVSGSDQVDHKGLTSFNMRLDLTRN